MIKMRWVTLIIFIFIITVLTLEWLEVLKLYNNLTNQDKYNNLTNPAKRNLKLLNVAKLRFHGYLRDFNKTYNNEEFERRFENFKASLKEIARLNRLENSTVFGLTKFSDMSKQEFADRMLLKPTKRSCTPMEMNCMGSQTNYEPFIKETYEDHIPASIDWRKKGFVKPVLNQRFCNGCWAFSIVGVLESMAAIQLNDKESRSIQELLDCSTETEGCNKGNVASAMHYICKNKLQFVTEEEYPMTLHIDQNCTLEPNKSGIRVRAFKHNCGMNETDMVKYVARHGPLVVAVDARNWQNYLGGIIRRACSSGISTHVVQLVGYEGYRELVSKTPVPYYIVRNSAGEDFGDHGYVNIAMPDRNVSNVCGIADKVTLMDVTDT